MLPRHAYLSATMLALAATMSEEDPVVSLPEPDDASPEPVLTGYAKLDAALSGLPAGSLGCVVGGLSSGRNMYKEYIERERDAPDLGALLRCVRAHERPGQRAAKKARAKRKAKKGWA